jgi:hypothetical protein
VNTHAEYRRHNYRPPSSLVTAPGTEAVTSELARYRDPSLPAAERQTRTRAAEGVAWVRPTELATFLTPMVGRGIDLHAELVRRARRAPATTTRALERGAPHSAAPPQPASGMEGISL